jgi:hypothetical protein
MQNENWRFRRGCIDFLQRRHPAFGELEFAPATNHAHPLAGRVRLRLLSSTSQASASDGTPSSGVPSCNSARRE